MGALALGLDLPEDYFTKFTTGGIGTLRFIHYPPQAVTDPNARGIGAHRDFGTITLLMQDDVGGLQVQDPTTKEWIDVSLLQYL
jgi:isopenicillin N synthase-like dioxygenase